MSKKNTELELVYAVIGEDIARELDESELKLLEDTLYCGLMSSTINEIRKLQSKLKKMPKLQRMYLDNRFGFKPEVSEIEEKKQPEQPSFDNYVA
ncbi:MAG: hypothetical protein ACFFC6_11330 [Promethearchaeota archaeon]